MNTVEKIYQEVQDLPESLALEVLHFVEFLRSKNQSSKNQELEQKIQHGIDQANSGLGVTIDNNYVDRLNQRVQKSLASAQNEIT
jgi:hypothetical protein